MIRVGVVGATGYAGAELVRILAGHPEVTLTTITSRQYAGTRFSKIYPSMAGVVDLICDEMAMDRLCDQTEVVFTALPHKLPMEIVPALLENGKKVIDLSADFRFSDVSRYEAFYQPHSCGNLLDKAVYGLCEVYENRIRDAQLIGNPGCYPTSVLLPLVPLLKNRLIRTETLIADSKSGVSGAGRSPSLTSLFCEVHESFKAYKVTNHRHTPEMDEVLSRESGESVHITFTPHLVPMSRGMLTTIYAGLNEDVVAEDIEACLAFFYKNRPFVRLCREEMLPDTLNVKGTNFCDIGFRIDAASRRLILISAIDNLVKGAAGQAVQNMNIMLGMDQKTGLWNVPFPL
jgi:N-acetyl-gamma-glutamyl-phosphate reductase